MAELIIPDVDSSLLETLATQASSHGRTSAAEAKMILAQALQPSRGDWSGIDAIRSRLEAAGKIHSDSAELIHEDRQR
jgi:plasmid stability protein